MTSNQIPEQIGEISGTLYAGFWPRLGSLLLDALILIPVSMALGYIGGLDKSLYTITIFIQIIIALLFHVWMVWKYGGSPGKLAVGIKIIRIDGQDVGRHEAQLRYLVDFALVILSTITSYSALMALSNEDFVNMSLLEQGQYVSSYNPTLFSIQVWVTNIWVWGELIVLLTNKRKRAIHDFIAGTVVIKKAYHNRIKEYMNKDDGL